MEIYEKHYKLCSCDVDMYRRLRLSQLFTFTQEAAIHHTEILGAGREKTLDRGFLWVITMQHAEIKRLPEYDEEITLTSWAGKTMHVMFPRYFEFTDSKGECIIKGSALWVLIDAKNRKMIFPDAEGISVDGTATGREYRLPAPLKPQDTDKAESFTVPYSFCDINGHMTNTRYFDLAEDITKISQSGRVPKYVFAEYAGEARRGDKIDIDLSEGDSLVYLNATRDSKRVFKIKMDY